MPPEIDQISIFDLNALLHPTSRMGRHLPEVTLPILDPAHLCKALPFGHHLLNGSRCRKPHPSMALLSKKLTDSTL